VKGKDIRPNAKKLGKASEMSKDFIGKKSGWEGPKRLKDRADKMKGAFKWGKEGKKEGRRLEGEIV
jgi:hypothetical protein